MFNIYYYFKHIGNPYEMGDAGFKRALLRTGKYLLRLQLSDYR